MPPRNRVAVRPPADADATPDLKVLFSELARLETELWDAVEGRLQADHGVNLPTFELTAAGKRLLTRATVTVEYELRRRLRTVMPEGSLAQFTRTLTKLRTAVRSAGTAEAAAGARRWVRANMMGRHWWLPSYYPEGVASW